VLNGVLEKNDLQVIHIHAGAPYPVGEHHCQQDDCRVLETRVNRPVLLTSWNLLKSNTKAQRAKAESSKDMEHTDNKESQSKMGKKKATFIKVITSQKATTHLVLIAILPNDNKHLELRIIQYILLQHYLVIKVKEIVRSLHRRSG
jgi:hypothetical protein